VDNIKLFRREMVCEDAR